jgi:hypothetical protein
MCHPAWQRALTAEHHRRERTPASGPRPETSVDDGTPGPTVRHHELVRTTSCWVARVIAT